MAISIENTSSSAFIPPADIDRDSAIARARRRLVPFLMLMYIASFLDRANIGFAKQALQASVGISEATYALAAGLFFVSYSLLGFPSNLILHKIGAKVWMAGIMVVWGVVSMATMFVTGSASFYVLRLALGAAEAGFFPGVILYLTYWFPNRERGQMLGLFYLGVPLAMIFGSPFSGYLLEMHPIAGLSNWQWMFVVEGLFASVIGVAAYWCLEDRPANARWFRGGEQQALVDALAHEEHEKRFTGAPARLLSTVCDWRVLQFTLIYCLIQISVYGSVFYLPTQVSALLHKPVGLEVGLVSAIPWLCASIALVGLPRVADKYNKRRPFAALALLISGLASFVFPTAAPLTALIALSIAVAGFISVQPLFWTFPTSYLSDRAAAGGIALITMGNLGAFIAPNLKVWADQYFHSPRAGLYLLAAITVFNAGLIALASTRRSQADPHQALETPAHAESS